MPLTQTRPAGFGTSGNDYSYQDPQTGMTWYGTYGDGSALPSSAPSTPSAVGTGAITNPSGTATGGGGGGGGLGGLVDGIAYGNTQNFELQKKQVEAAIADAQGRLQVARDAEERQRAFLELQKWTAERDRILAVQKQYTDTALALITAASKGGPNNYFQANAATSGGRDIFDQIRGNQPRADFSAFEGRPVPLSVADIMGQLGMPTLPQTTPLGGTPGSTTPGAPPGTAPGAQGTVTQAQADQLAAGLALDKRYVYGFVQEKGRLPNGIPELNDYLNAKGWRDPTTGALKPGGADWSGGQQAAQMSGGGSQAAAGMGGGAAAASVGGSAPTGAPPASPAAPYDIIRANLAGYTDPATREMMRLFYERGGRQGGFDPNNQPGQTGSEVSGTGNDSWTESGGGWNR